MTLIHPARVLCKVQAFRRPSSSGRDPALASSSGKADDDRDEDFEKSGRAKVRDVQNRGTAAYSKKDFATAKAEFSEALRLLEELNNATRPSRTEAPSRVLAERDGVKVKLLKFLSKAYEKTDDAQRAQDIFGESKVIEKRLADYQRRKKEAQRA